jgi:hypothetical protein
MAHWTQRGDAPERYLATRGFFRKRGRFDEDWIDRLAIMGKISGEDWDRWNGKHFNIPECCVEWYLTLTDLRSNNDGFIKHMESIWGEDDLEKYEYVRCMDCRLKEALDGLSD